jgi:ABC-2 type transport system permease protein
MIRAAKIRAVATFEFLSTVKRKAYIVTTFGMPLFVAMYGGIVSIPGYFMSQKEAEVKPYGLIDRSGLLRLEEGERIETGELPPEVRAAVEALERSSQQAASFAFGNAVLLAFEDEARASAAVIDGTLRGYYVLPERYLESGEVSYYRRDAGSIQLGDARSALRSLIVERLVDGRLDGQIAERVRRPLVRTETFALTEAGVTEPTSRMQELARLLIPIAFAVLLFTSLMMSAGYLIQAIAIEKENKVVEVLLSSANPDEILFGKLTGLGVAGLLQVLVWYGFLLVSGLLFAGALTSLGVEVPWLTIGMAIALFVVAYLFLGSLMLGTGSLGSTVRESQQLSMVWTLLSVVPMMMLGIFLAEPNGLLAKVFTWIPFTAPLTMILRVSLEPEGVRWWEIAGCFAVMLGSIWIGIRLGARLFRVGLLMTGARPRLREILRQARLAS